MSTKIDKEEMNTPFPIIHDGDHGSDDVITSLLLLAYPEKFNLLGITTQLGNVTAEIAAKNALRCLDIAGRNDVPVFIGSKRPFGQPDFPIGDNAFGDNGIGGVFLPEPKLQVQELPALDFIIGALEASQVPVHFALTGPCTNFAFLLKKRPDLKNKIGTVAIMGGCIEPQGPQARRGNITPHAEFNFFMDPEAADFVLASGLDIVLFPLDLTHQILFDEKRKENLIASCGAERGKVFSDIMLAASHLDEKNFGVKGAYQHDQQTALYFIDNELFGYESLTLGVVTEGEERGRSRPAENTARKSVRIALRLKDANANLNIVTDSLKKMSL